MRRSRISCCLLLALTGAWPVQAQPPAGTIQVDGSAIAWKPAPPGLPEGATIAVLEGDPSAEGVFTLRIRVPAGSRLAAHTHPRPERVTILSGAVGVGFGTHYDQTRLKVFRAGDFYVNPPGHPHFVSFATDSEVQITGQGPWVVEPAKR